MVALAAASWGTWSLFLRPTGLPATTTSPILFGVMGLVTLPFALRGPRVRWDRTTVGLIVLNAAFDALNVLGYFAAISTTTVAVAVLTHYAAPIIIALAAPAVNRRFPVDDGAPPQAAGDHTVPAAIVALGGLVVVLEPWHAAAAGAALGAVLGLASAVCYAGNTFVVQRLAARIGATRAMSFHSLVAAVALAPFAIAGASSIATPDLGLLVTGAVSIGAVSGIVFAVGLLRIGPARAAVLTFAEPLVAVAVGALVWEEPLHPLAAVGGALVLGAGITVARDSRTAAREPR